MRPFIRAHPVAAFVALTVLFSYGLGVPWLWAVGAFMPRLPAIAALYLGRLLVVAGPTLAALVVARAVHGRRGVAAWLGGLRRRRLRAADLVWWAVIPPATLAATALAYWLTGTPAEPLLAAVGRGWPVLLTHYVLQSAVVGVGEELGWRGWMLPALLRAHSYAGATTRVAVVWCLWHLPALLQGGGFALSFATLAVALSFLFTALWARTRRSVLAVAFAHGSVNAPQFFFATAVGAPAAGAPSYAPWYAACALYVAVALLVVAPRWRWWSQPDGGARAQAPAVA